MPAIRNRQLELISSEKDLCQHQSKTLSPNCLHGSQCQRCRCPQYTAETCCDTRHRSDCRSSSRSTDSSGLQMKGKKRTFICRYLHHKSLYTLWCGFVSRRGLDTGPSHSRARRVLRKDRDISDRQLMCDHPYSQSTGPPQSECCYQHRCLQHILSLSSRSSNFPTAHRPSLV